MNVKHRRPKIQSFIAQNVKDSSKNNTDSLDSQGQSTKQIHSNQQRSIEFQQNVQGNQKVTIKSSTVGNSKYSLISDLDWFQKNRQTYFDKDYCYDILK